MCLCISIQEHGATMQTALRIHLATEETKQIAMQNVKQEVVFQ